MYFNRNHLRLLARRRVVEKTRRTPPGRDRDNGRGIEGRPRSTSLTKIRLIGTKVTDAGVKELGTIETSTVVLLADTKVTDAGVKELQKALPKCFIVR